MNFADALDAALERGTYESPRAPRSTATFTSRHANPFLYSALGVPFVQRRVFSEPQPSTADSSLRDCAPRHSAVFTTTGTAWCGNPKNREESEGDGECGDASQDPEPQPREERSERPRTVSRMLTVVERRALETLVQHGACLTPAFSAVDLRREYRRLARRLHPDAHPECTAAELAQMSAQFAVVSSSYQVLIAVR